MINQLNNYELKIDDPTSMSQTPNEVVRCKSPFKPTNKKIKQKHKSFISDLNNTILN